MPAVARAAAQQQNAPIARQVQQQDKHVRSMFAPNNATAKMPINASGQQQQQRSSNILSPPSRFFFLSVQLVSDQNKFF